MNPEEGELRPQLLDRFGLCVRVEGLRDSGDRVEILERRMQFEENAASFMKTWAHESELLAHRITEAKRRLGGVRADRDMLLQIADTCLRVGVDGHRGDIIALKCAKALAAYEERDRVESRDVERALELSLPHRVRRQPFQDIAPDAEAFRGFVRGDEP
jgi:magnesium chelatase subunit I